MRNLIQDLIFFAILKKKAIAGDFFCLLMNSYSKMRYDAIGEVMAHIVKRCVNCTNAHMLSHFKGTKIGLSFLFQQSPAWKDYVLWLGSNPPQCDCQSPPMK